MRHNFLITLLSLALILPLSSAATAQSQSDSDSIIYLSSGPDKRYVLYEGLLRPVG